MELTDEFVQGYGFTDLNEMFSMVASVDLTTQEKLVKFKHWQNEDGSKSGLESLLNGN